MGSEFWIPALGLAATLLLVGVGLLNFSVFLRQLKLAHSQMDASHRKAMFRAEDLLPALPPDFETVVAEQRPRTTTRDGVTVEVPDATVLVRRRAPGTATASRGPTASPA